jgi:arylsulfatase A-like enzyme
VSDCTIFEPKDFLNMNRMLLIAALLLPLAQTCLAAGDLPPNIVLIFVDDMGYGDLGCYGNQLHNTPNIDRLAAEGQRWTSFYSSGATCVPSRRGLMTGRHPALMGNANLVESRDKLMAAMLKKHGYRTAILGKWHLAGYPKDFTTAPMHPLNCGFDYHFGTPGSNDVPAPSGRVQNRALFDTCDRFTFQVPLIRGRDIVEYPANQELFTSRYTAQAVQWIGENRDQPFFLYLAHNMPHAPVFASEEFQGKSKGGRYGDVVEEIDWSVGQVLQAVRDKGLDKRTLVVFTSDNGPWSMFGPHGGTGGPLRGEKGTCWEGGYRVPGIFRWPGRIKPAVVDGLAANLDLYATFAHLASGSAVPEDVAQQKDYVSLDLTPTLLQEKPSPRDWWIYRSGGANAFRSGRYKIHFSTKDRSSNPDTRKREPLARHDPPLLFDLLEDIGEQHNLSADHPEIVERLVAELAALRR